MLNTKDMQVYTLPVPAEMAGYVSGTFTATGSVLADWHLPGEENDYIHLSVLNKDGSDPRQIFAGLIPTRPGANGIRFMCYADGKRILLGDYVLECSPDLDHCTETTLVPILYPPMETGPYAHRWSEIVISPDEEYMAWTALLGLSGSVNLLGRLVREKDAYVLRDVRTISMLDGWKPDEDHPGFVRPLPLLGGEIKQFVRGGTALSIAGVGPHSALCDSVIQDLASGSLTQITRSPGYDETTILSPDERLGISMSTRFSPETGCAVLGLMPRPFASRTLSQMMMPVYLYAIASVRKHGCGSIGPALSDIERSISDPEYRGIDLSDPEGGWTYCSPMSWHPDGKHAMWNEVSPAGQKRIRIVSLPEQEAGAPVPVSRTPETIAFAQPADAIRPVDTGMLSEVRVKGREGEFTLKYTPDGSISSYDHYTEDGESFWNGTEKVTQSSNRFRYEADLTLTGPRQGRMALTLSFVSNDHFDTCLLDASPDADGQPRSRGYASYGDKILYVKDMP